MEYIDYFERILNSDFLQKGDEALTMIEHDNGIDRVQKVNVVSNSNSISKMRLYCFNDFEKGTATLFPFFNQQTGGSNKAPHGLNSFCDYILLVQHNKGLFVFFLEMKRGVNGDAEKQIEAAVTLFDYILKTAVRIKSINSFPDFDAEQVRYRKIIISESHSKKRRTKETINKDLDDFDMNEVIPHKCHDEFSPVGYCERN